MNKFCISQFFEDVNSLVRVTCEIYKKWGTTNSYHCPVLHFQLKLAILVKFRQNKLSQDQKKMQLKLKNKKEKQLDQKFLILPNFD